MAGTAETLYERVGGALAVQAVVLRLYRYILSDGELSPFFKHIDVDRLRRSQEAFVSYALGGDTGYTGRSMREAHQSAVQQGLADKHFDLVAYYLARSMKDLNIDADLINEAMATVGATRNDVLNR